ETEPADILDFDRDSDRWGDVWSMFVPGVGVGQLYHFQASGPHDPDRGHWFNPHARLIDPFAKALVGSFQPATDGIIRPPKCVVVSDFFDWEGDRHLRYELSDSIIYELHVRGFTQHSSSGVEHPGTYLGVIEKIPYLKSLGVTAVELMPVHEFPKNLFNGAPHPRPNYWGYDPLAFFAPHSGYGSSSTPGGHIHEFKQMVRALHQAGIEVILDVVFNHTCEGNHLGPVLSFKGLENSVYYMLEHDRRYYRNYSGCGNTINGNHPIVREMIFHCLRHWVHNYHIDGFRFDLASILSRDRSGNLVANPPLIEVISEDPLLSDTKIIAEAWDAAGAYQVGSFGSERWAEWNGRYRDDVRRYWRGDLGLRGPLATRLAGSADLYQPGGRAPYSSINFVTSHDGFTLNDLVSFRDKHNHANGEDNRDGENHNLNDNYGHEGPSEDPLIESIRQRQIKNMLATLLVSQGVPMLLMGDEVRRTQLGNNNAYCQDNEISWLNWDHLRRHADVLRFYQGLVHFRRNQPTVRRAQFLTGNTDAATGLPDVSWFSPMGTAVNWEKPEHCLICVLIPSRSSDDPHLNAKAVMMLFNADQRSRQFVIPAVASVHTWRLFADTAAESPYDLYDQEPGPMLPISNIVEMTDRSMKIYVSHT
ncbi:MAG TPA: glycogen debranching protein GlgX, partial [Pirellulaceae bacterium]|nr:glycogen debranching protein GlgX [Pirellulaceae bacterium]